MYNVKILSNENFASLENVEDLQIVRKGDFKHIAIKYNDGKIIYTDSFFIHDANELRECENTYNNIKNMIDSKKETKLQTTSPLPIKLDNAEFVNVNVSYHKDIIKNDVTVKYNNGSNERVACNLDVKEANDMAKKLNLAMNINTTMILNENLNPDKPIEIYKQEFIKNVGTKNSYNLNIYIKNIE